MKTLLKTALTMSMSLTAVCASAMIIDFENLTVGTTLSNQYAGVTFAANAFSGPGSSSSGKPWATNTDMTIVSSLAGGDVGGLGTPSLVSGHVLHSFSGWLVKTATRGSASPARSTRSAPPLPGCQRWPTFAPLPTTVQPCSARSLAR